ncbi:MAG: hypothetical protein OdinLCB4_004745 [Candidatus Odinarchaeum yellowstonii]|uniref:Longin domain-containing protein n=1 Tax=Odinarchaeota yellowstonii (strain LCB_4) TaxID=1841599 RepID=A0AAF0D154_ODILC|nr:MAG: hypothetical protein OdinLCB4_004745 [Candidatus Odinarchaeum yellowstonii]
MNLMIYCVFVIQRIDGVCLFSKIYSLPTSGINAECFSDEDKYNILSGFISAVSTIVTNVADDYIKEMRLEGEKHIKIIVETGDKIAIGVVADKAESDRKLYGLAKSLVKQFNYLYGEKLKTWNGDTGAFKIFDKVVDTEIGNTERDFTEYL